MSVSVAPSADLTHVASGIKLRDLVETLVSGRGLASQLLVPHSSQSGFVDETGAAVSSWYYIATITSTVASGAPAAAPQTRSFSLPTGTPAVVELETLPAHRPLPPEDPDVPEANLPPRLSPEALNATYVPVAAAVPLDTTNAPLALGVASPGAGTAGASPSDHVHAVPALTELADVTSGLTPTAGQAVVWDATAGKWKAGAPAAAAGSPLWTFINSGEITLPRGHTDDSSSFGSNPASGEMRLTYFRAQNTATRSTVRFQTGGSAAATSTLARIGIYSVDEATGNLVALLASCTNKTTFSGTYAQQTCTLTASVPLVAGTMYAVGILQVAGTPASVAGQWFNGTFMGAGPKLARKLTGLTDLPAGPVTSGFADTQFPVYVELV